MTSPFDDKKAMALVEVRARFRQKAEYLKKACLDLSERLKRVATECDRARDDKEYSINGLGEVQGAGIDIDRACAELRLLDDVRALTKWINVIDAEPTPAAAPTRALRKPRN